MVLITIDTVLSCPVSLGDLVHSLRSVCVCHSHYAIVFHDRAHDPAGSNCLMFRNAKTFSIMLCGNAANFHLLFCVVLDAGTSEVVLCLNSRLAPYRSVSESSRAGSGCSVVPVLAVRLCMGVESGGTEGMRPLQ